MLEAASAGQISVLIVGIGLFDAGMVGASIAMPGQIYDGLTPERKKQLRDRPEFVRVYRGGFIATAAVWTVALSTACLLNVNLFAVFISSCVGFAAVFVVTRQLAKRPRDTGIRQG